MKMDKVTFTDDNGQTVTLAKQVCDECEITFFGWENKWGLCSECFVFGKKSPLKK